jgi:hypothetical protein
MDKGLTSWKGYEFGDEKVKTSEFLISTGGCAEDDANVPKGWKLRFARCEVGGSLVSTCGCTEDDENVPKGWKARFVRWKYFCRKE